MNLMTAQKGNEYLKKFLSKIDLFQIETNYYKSSDIDNQVRYKLYEIMTFHQGRRTFITNMLDKGYSAVEVMRRTDHTKISTLEKYVSPKGYSQKNKLNLYE
mgnify:FL=1